jgi:hypothetical protein
VFLRVLPEDLEDLKSWTLTGHIKMPPAVYKEMGFPSRSPRIRVTIPRGREIRREERLDADEWESFRWMYTAEVAEVLLERKIISRWSNLIMANTEKCLKNLKLDFREFRILKISH